MLRGLFSRDRIVAPPDFNRWMVPPASIAIHLCIGSVYAWSMFNPVLTRVNGVVKSSSDDWTLQQVVPIFAIAIVFLGLSAAFAGRWLERVGPRVVGTISAICWGGGFLVGGFGILRHEIWLLYLGYGVIGGCGLGLGYISPVSTLIKWFPDRRGLASGMAIMGFGGGSLIATPLKQYLIRLFYEAPQYLGLSSAVKLVTIEGKRFATVAGQLREVVVVSESEAAAMIKPGPEGVYLVGTGQTGVAETFFVLGAIYFLVMLIAAFSYRIPALGWKPKGWNPPSPDQSGTLISSRHVDANQAMKTPQFYLLWIILCLNVTAGIGVLVIAKTMMRDIFGTTLSETVDETFISTFVIMTSVFNMIGRFLWASASDYLGRKMTYNLFFIFGVLLYLSIPWCAYRVGVSESALWLVLFYVSTMIILTMYGGGFATIPAYIADLFGTRFVGAIHGRILTAWSVAGVLGPIAITWLRSLAIRDSIQDLASKVDPSEFAQKFGAPVSELNALVEQKTVTIAGLMDIAPKGTINPTSTVYNSTMFLMAGLLVIALIANLMVRPVDPKHHLNESE